MALRWLCKRQTGQNSATALHLSFPPPCFLFFPYLLFTPSFLLLYFFLFPPSPLPLFSPPFSRFPPSLPCAPLSPSPICSCDAWTLWMREKQSSSGPIGLLTCCTVFGDRGLDRLFLGAARLGDVGLDRLFLGVARPGELGLDRVFLGVARLGEEGLDRAFLAGARLGAERSWPCLGRVESNATLFMEADLGGPGLSVTGREHLCSSIRQPWSTQERPG